MDIADIGAGTGFFALLMAQQVAPGGHVYAVDIEPNFVEASEKRAKAHGINNVTGIVNSSKSVQLPAGSVDLAFISDTYHHFEYPRSTMLSIHQALRTQGELVVIDFKRIPGVSNQWVLDHVRLDELQAIQEIESFGFELVEQLDFMQTQYFLRFRKQVKTASE